MSECGLYGIDPKKYKLPTTSFYRVIKDEETVLCKEEREVHEIDEAKMSCKKCGLELPGDEKASKNNAK